MIFKSSYPNSPDVSVVISGVSVDYTTIQSVSIETNENMHDIATITFSGFLTKGITDYIGVPIYISIGVSNTRFISFYGHISFIEPVMETRKGLVNNSPVQTAVATCMSASYDMSDTKNKIWQKITLSNLVQSIASTYDYSYSVPIDDYIFNSLLQNGISDWDLLKKACTSIGYCMTTSGTHIHVYDPYKAISRQLPYVELLTVRGALGNMDYRPGNIMEFRGLFGDITLDGAVSNYNFIGVDSSGTVLTSSTSDTNFTKLGEAVERKYTQEVATNVNSIQELNRYAEASTKGNYPYNATAVVTGVPDPVPGSVVKIDNYDSYFDGYWLVRGAKHMVTRSNYLTELVISTDSNNGVKPVNQPGSAYKTPPVPKLSGNRWISSVEFADVYAN
jgi:phage protein D